MQTELRESFDRLVGGGVATEGGIWTLVYGFPVIESGSDFWSIVDNQGRRWIRIDRLSEQAERSKASSKYLSDLERLGEAIHDPGDYEVKVRLYREVQATVNLSVIPEGYVEPIDLPEAVAIDDEQNSTEISEASSSDNEQLEEPKSDELEEDAADSQGTNE